MIDRIRVARWAVVGGVLLAVGVAGATTTTKVKRWAAGDACLCTPDTQEPAGLRAAPGPAGTSTSFSRGGGLAVVSSTSTAGPLVPVPLAAMQYAAANAGEGGAWRLGSVGWSGRSRNQGAYSSSSGGVHASAGGGLWRLMGLTRHSSQATEHVKVQKSASSTPRAPQRGGSSRPPASGSGAVAPVPAVAPPSGLFAEQATPIAELLNGGAAAAIGGVAGGVGAAAGGGASLAATPEPGSILLFGTGLLGAVGMLRRRRT